MPARGVLRCIEARPFDFTWAVGGPDSLASVPWQFLLTPTGVTLTGPEAEAYGGVFYWNANPGTTTNSVAIQPLLWGQDGGSAAHPGYDNEYGIPFSAYWTWNGSLGRRIPEVLTARANRRLCYVPVTLSTTTWFQVLDACGSGGMQSAQQASFPLKNGVNAGRLGTQWVYIGEVAGRQRYKLLAWSGIEYRNVPGVPGQLQAKRYEAIPGVEVVDWMVFEVYDGEGVLDAVTGSGESCCDVIREIRDIVSSMAADVGFIKGDVESIRAYLQALTSPELPSNPGADPDQPTLQTYTTGKVGQTLNAVYNPDEAGDNWKPSNPFGEHPAGGGSSSPTLSFTLPLSTFSDLDDRTWTVSFAFYEPWRQIVRVMFLIPLAIWGGGRVWQEFRRQ